MQLTVFVKTSKLGSMVEETIEIDDEELEGLSSEEKADTIDCHVHNWACNNITWGWNKINKVKSNKRELIGKIFEQPKRVDNIPMHH